MGELITLLITAETERKEGLYDYEFFDRISTYLLKCERK